MFKCVISLLFFYLIYLSHFVESQKNNDDIIIFQKKNLQQSQNLYIQEINLQVNGKQIDQKTPENDISIILELQDSIFSNFPQNNNMPNFFQADCKNISCQQDLYLAIIYSFSLNELQIIYQNFKNTNALPLFDYKNRMDYNAFLKQKKSHKILIPFSSIKDNAIKIYIGIYNFASKVGIINNYKQVSFAYDLSIKYISKNNNQCSNVCPYDSSQCNTNTQKCVCFENYFDLDCSYYASNFQNTFDLNKKINSNLQQSQSYLSSGQNLQKVFNQEIQQINPGNWKYYYWEIDSNLFLQAQQNFPSSQSNNQSFDIFLTFDRIKFKDISVSFIYYGQDEIYVPNIFLNYSKISQLSQDQNYGYQSKQNANQKTSSFNEPFIKISYNDLQNYILMYRQNKLIEVLNVDTKIIFGFKNEGKTKTPGNLKFNITIQYKQDALLNQSANTTINQEVANVDVSESQQKNSYIIIISCVSIIFFLVILVFLFRKKICPNRYLSESKSQQELNKKTPSNISIAADSSSRKRIDSNSIRLQQQSLNHYPLQNLLIDGNEQSNNEQYQQFKSPIFQQQPKIQSRTNSSSIFFQKDSTTNFQNNLLGQKGKALQNPVTTCSCTMNNISNSKIVQREGQTIINLQSSFQNLVSNQTQQNIYKSNNLIEEMNEIELNSKQQSQQGIQTKRVYDQISMNSLQNINGPQTVSQLNQLTTQINTDRITQQQQNYQPINLQQHFIVECEQCVNKRKKFEHGNQINKKNLQQPFEVLEVDEAITHEDSVNLFKKIKKDNISGQDFVQQSNENCLQIQDLSKQKSINRASKQESEENQNSTLYKQAFLKKINANTNNFLFEQFILHGSVVFKEKWTKTQHKNNSKKNKQRIHYKLSLKSKLKKLRRKKKRVSNELEEEIQHNNSYKFKQNVKSIFSKRILGKNGSITSSYFSQQHLKNSNSSRMVNSGKSIRKVQNGIKGAVSRFFYTQNKPNSSNTLKFQNQKQFGSFDLDASSNQKKIKMAESIFTGLNPSSHNNSMDGSKLKSYQTLDMTEQNSKVIQNIYENITPPKTNPSIYKKKLLRDLNKNEEMMSKNEELLSKNDISISKTESKYSGSIFNINNKNNLTLKGNQTPRKDARFGSPQHSFGIKTLNQTDANFFKLGAQDTDANHLNVQGYLLPNYNMQSSKRSEDLSTPGFLKPRQQNPNSNQKPSVFFQQKFSSPQRSTVNDESQQLENEEKHLKLNQKYLFNQKYQTQNIISQQKKSLYLQKSQSLFDQNFQGNKDIDNKMNYLNNLNLETTIIKNSSIDENIHRNPIFNQKQFNIKCLTPNKPRRNEEQTITSFDNEQIQINQICFKDSGFNLRKIRSLNNYDYPSYQLPQIHEQKEVKQELKSENIISNQIKQTVEQQSVFQSKIPSLFCQNGFLFTNSASNKFNNDQKNVNIFLSSLSEISGSIMTSISNNNILEQDDKYVQNSTQFD